MVWITVLFVTGLTSLGYVMNKVYSHRSKINALRKQGIPMPKKWSWFTGHLLTLSKYVDRLPSDANVNLAMRELAREYADTEVFLMDFWPVYPPLLVVFSPEVAVQVSTQYNLPKTDMHLNFMRPITGGPNLISMNYNEWRFWRTLFNPGFSAAAMVDNVPLIVDSVQIFHDKLREQARVAGSICFLDHLTTKLTMDVIIKLTLDADLNCQRSENILVSALEQIIKWHSFWDPRVLLNPLRPFIQKYYGYVMNNYIRNELDKRFNELKQEQTMNDFPGNSRHAKSVIALALEAYMREKGDKDVSQTRKLEHSFSQYASYQIRLFLFAGTDTTSSSMVYAYHLLSKNPEALARLRKEHDDIFGSDPSKTTALLKQQPTLINQCKYTLAVIKETLRLYPPAATMRAGRAGVVVTDRHGNTYPMDNVGATILHPAIHGNPRVWPRVGEFLPERFLVEPGHELRFPSDAWRPFEQGPRNCLGQTLVYNEMLVVLIMTARDFNVKPAYEEWDTIKEKKTGLIGRIKRSVVGPPVKTVLGERAYQTEKAGTHPADGYPCYISMQESP